jgi:crossover junction endodeoxyribonuclease RusA
MPVEQWAFAVKGDPITQGSMSVFNGRIVHQKTRELTAWRNAIAVACRDVMDRPLEGAVLVEATFSLRAPATGKRRLPHVRPDIDKLARALLDGLTGPAFADDGQVVRLVCSKRYGIPGVSVRIVAVADPDLFD